jgi:hypothetical protein
MNMDTDMENVRKTSGRHLEIVVFEQFHLRRELAGDFQVALATTRELCNGIGVEMQTASEMSIRKLVGHPVSSNCSLESSTGPFSMNFGSDWLRGVNLAAIIFHHILCPSGSSFIVIHSDR